MVDVVGFLRGCLVMYFFIVALVMINLLLLVSYVLALGGLISEEQNRRFANFCTGSSWCFYPQSMEAEGGHRVVVYGMAPPRTDNVLVMANHIEAPDWSIVFWLACAANHLSHLKVFAKKSISYVPLIGTGMRAMGMVFLSRSWERDKKSIEATFSHLRRSKLPYWLLTHPEGTRATPFKVVESQAFAQTHNLPLLSNVLLPRVKGLVATLEGLRHNSLHSVLDVTLCWDRRPGPLAFFFLGGGGACTVHALLREYPVSELPEAGPDLLKWIYDRWREKDDFVGTFRRTGSFGVPIVPVDIPESRYSGLMFWKVIVGFITIFGVYSIIL